MDLFRISTKNVRGCVRPLVRPSVGPPVRCYFRTTKNDFFEAKTFVNDEMTNDTISADEVVAALVNIKGNVDIKAKSKTLWCRIIKNTDWSTGPLARPFACSLAPLTHSLALYYSLRLRAPLRSLVHSLAHFAPFAHRKVNESYLFCVFFCSGPKCKRGTQESARRDICA